MANRFEKHYTREEARALLPSIRQWLEKLEELRVALEKTDQRLEGMADSGQDLGGDLVNRSITLLAEMQKVFGEFQKREILVKDLDRGLIDFPALVGGREVFLCWEKDEVDVEFWHDIDSGYSGREPL